MLVCQYQIFAVVDRKKARWSRVFICVVSSLPQKVEVQAPPGETIGYVKQGWSICKPKFYICDAEGDTILRIEGPCCTCSICGDVEFQVCWQCWALTFA